MLWKREKVEALSRKLDSCRLELNSQVLTLLNARSRLLEKGQNDIATGQKKILEAVAFTNGHSTAAHDSRGAASSPLQMVPNENNVISTENPPPKITTQLRRENAVVLLVTLEDGSTETMSFVPKTTTGITSSEPVDIDTATTFRIGSRYIGTESASVEQYAPLAQIVLDSLYFPVIHVRKEEIAEAHRKTFEWIFSQGQFINFLEHEVGYFWLTGKAGSGKSTLMKFLYQHDRTEDILKRWAGNDQLLNASFFFWNAGSHLQKSQEGLLRSILLEILNRHHDLILVAFPEFCRTYLRTHEFDTKWLRFSQLKSGLRRILLETPAKVVKICLFVDGMDEYEGDHLELCEFLAEIATSPHVKLVLSSRPWNIFKVYFDESIRTQDLTRQDIEIYVTDKLVNNPVMTRLGKDSRSNAEKIVQRIADRAEGVFLWVVLVVRSLLNGLCEGDGLHELEQRLEVLPGELGELYRHMLQNLDPIYQREAAKMFLVVLRGRMLADGGVSLLQLSYACDETVDAAIRAPRDVLSADELESLHQHMTKRVTSRCRGLLEVYQAYEFPGDDSCFSTGESFGLDKYVGFLHRTVIEFLESDQGRSEIANGLPDGTFDPEVALLASSLHEAKVSPFGTDVMLPANRALHKTLICLGIAACLEILRQRPFTVVLDELSSTMSVRWKAAKRFKWSNEGVWQESDDEWKDTQLVQWPLALKQQCLFFEPSREPIPQTEATETESFWELANFVGCVLYASDKMTINKTESGLKSILLRDAIVALFRGLEYDPDLPVSRTSLRAKNVIAAGRMLQQGADSNAAFKITSTLSPLYRLLDKAPFDEASEWPRIKSTWEYYLMHLWFLSTASRQKVAHGEELDSFREASLAAMHLQICREFLENGAVLWPDFSEFDEDPGVSDVVENFKQAAGRPPGSVLEILQRLYEVFCDPAKRTFAVNLQSNDLDTVRAEFSKTMDVLQARHVAQKQFWKPDRLSRSFRTFLASLTGRPVLSSILSGIVIAVVAVLLGIFL